MELPRLRNRSRGAPLAGGAACEPALDAVIVRVLNDQEFLELGIIENVQRADLNAIVEAGGYRN